MREVVTIQVGGYANFVGAHFWNLLDESLAQHGFAGEAELLPFAFFRESSVRGSPLPYAPRLQTIDLDGAYGTLSVDAGYTLPVALQDALGQQSLDDADDAAWHGRVSRYARPRVAVNEYLRSLDEEDTAVEPSGHDPLNVKQARGDHGGKVGSVGDVSVTRKPTAADGATESLGLENGAKFWSDYLKVRFHPRSCQVVRGVHHEVNDFSMLGRGIAEASDGVLDDNYSQLRFFLEECDSLSGIVMMCDASNGFSGFGARYIAHLQDELGSSAAFTIFGSSPGAQCSSSSTSMTIARSRQLHRHCEAHLVATAIEHGAQYIPLHGEASAFLPYYRPEPLSQFQTAAPLAVAADIALTSLRARNAALSMGQLHRLLRPSPLATFSQVAIALPASSPFQCTRSALLENDMTRCSVIGDDAIQGGRQGTRIDERRLAAPPVAELVSTRGIPGNHDCLARVVEPLALPVPFPRVFDARVTMTGKVLHQPEGQGSETELVEVGESAAAASMFTDRVDGSTALAAWASVMSNAGRARVPYPGDPEPFLLSEFAESLRSKSEDYLSL